MTGVQTCALPIFSNINCYKNITDDHDDEEDTLIEFSQAVQFWSSVFKENVDQSYAIVPHCVTMELSANFCAWGNGS